MTYETFVADTEAKIARYGLAVIGVGCEPGNPGFAYSVGLTDRGWPELIIVGLRADLAQGVINALAAKPAAPALGETITDTANLPLRVGAVSDKAIDEYLCQASARAERRGQGPITALQIIYPDAGGRFPGDEGYALLDAIQPILAPELN